jgi:dihydropteroate synthase
MKHEKLVLDPKGYFLIKITRKKIHIGLFNYKKELMFEYKGNTASEVYRKLIQEKVLTRLDHAAYLGKELYKVELAIKYKLKYVQDDDLIIK